MIADSAATPGLAVDSRLEVKSVGVWKCAFSRSQAVLPCRTTGKRCWVRAGGVMEAESESREVKELENEIRDLQITNKAKDMYIERMEKERDGFFEQVISANRKVGELEAKMLQLERPQ